MKKNLFMVAAVALMVLTACNKEEVAGGNPADNQTPATVEFTASFADTKTTLNNEGKKTLWEETDRIDINGQEFKIKELVDGGLSAIFENVNELPGDFAAPFTATYPYGKTEVPATQTAIAGTFDPAAVLETAISNDHNLSFTNVTSLLKFQVPAACQTVTISSDDDLAGSSAKTVTVTGPFETDKTYYAAVLPGPKANFVVRIDGYLSKNAASVTIAESTIANMQTLPAPVASDYSICSSKTGWNFNNMTPMYNDIDGYFVAKNIDVEYFSIFHKDVIGWGDDRRYGPNGEEIAVSGLAKWNTTKNKDANAFRVSDPNKKYDVYFNLTNNKVYIADAGISLPDESNVFSLIGLGGEWNNLDVVCVKYDNTRYVARNIVIPSGGFKVRKNYSWDNSWGYDTIIELDTKYTLNQKDKNNIKYSNNTSEYDVYITLAGSGVNIYADKFAVVEAGDAAPTL